MKSKTSTKARPEYTILEKGGVFKVFDKNEHFRCSFATRQAAQAYIDQRMGKAPMRTLEPAQPAAQAS